MTLYKKKYRVESARKPQHDYGSKGAYFVTVCTKKKLQWFGEIRNGKMQLSTVGEIVKQEWLKTATLRNYVIIGKWCIMPDHLHGIIQIHAERRDAPLGRLHEKEIGKRSDELGRLLKQSLETPQRGVSTKANDRWFVRSLGSVVNQFKGAATKRTHKSGFVEFSWQSRYHDRIIRSEKELAAIKKYIARNPDTWDKENIPWHADAASWSL